MILKRSIHEKNLQNEKKKKLQFEENVLPIGVKNKITRAWLKNKKLSCRYDCFFLLYTFIMRPILENEKSNKAVRVYSKISDEIAPFGSYVKMFKNIIYPKFIVFFIDFGDINDKAKQVYAQLSKNCNKIINFLEPSFNISNNIYELKGLICLESSYHFVGYLINLEKDIYDLKKNLITYMMD